MSQLIKYWLIHLFLRAGKLTMAKVRCVWCGTGINVEKTRKVS